MWKCDSLLTVTTINNMGFIENNVVENKKKNVKCLVWCLTEILLTWKHKAPNTVHPPFQIVLFYTKTIHNQTHALQPIKKLHESLITREIIQVNIKERGIIQRIRKYKKSIFCLILLRVRFEFRLTWLWHYVCYFHSRL